LFFIIKDWLEERVDRGQYVELSRGSLSSGVDRKNEVLHRNLHETLLNRGFGYNGPIGVVQGAYAGGVYISPNELFQLYLSGERGRSCTKIEFQLDYRHIKRKFGRRDSKKPFSIRELKRIAQFADNLKWNEQEESSLKYIDGHWPFNHQTNKLDIGWIRLGKGITKVVIPETLELMRFFQERFSK